MFGHLTDLKGTRDRFFHFSSIFSSSQRLIGELLVCIHAPASVVIVVNHFQTSSPPKPLGHSMPKFM